VHNFKDFITEEEVDKHIKDDIVDGLGAEKREEGIWKQDDIYHLVVAREGSTAGNTYNNRTITFLREQIEKVKYEVNEDMEINSTITKTLSILMHQYLYLPGTNKTLPVFINPVEHVFTERERRSVYKQWLEMIENTKDFLQNKFNQLTSWFSSTGNVDIDPFKTRIFTNSTNHTILDLEVKQNELFYAPLGKYKELDKSFPIKRDVIRIGKNLTHVVDMPGVTESNLNFTCDTDKITVFGLRTVPEIYSKFLKKTEHLKRQERRFNSFSFTLEFPRQQGRRKLPLFNCDLRHTYKLEDGVLYLNFWEE